MAWPRKPRGEAKPEDKREAGSPEEDAPRTINGIRVAKASTIVRQG